MRWHHIIGLLFAGFVFTWILSGLMSMNPLALFNAAGERPSVVAYQGGLPRAQGILADSAVIITRLQKQGLDAVEMEWRVLAWQPYILARDAAGRSRLVTSSTAGELQIREHWAEDRKSTRLNSS